MTRRVGLIVYPDFQLLDATGPTAAFEVAARSVAPPPYALELLSQAGGTVRSSSGVRVLTEPFHEGPFDILMVAGGVGVRAAATCEATLAFLKGVRPRRTASVCSGTYVLAEAGLLDGRRATTHWRVADDLRRRYPRIRVDADAIFVRDDPVWTSAGVTAGIDLALAMIADDLGEGASRRAA